MSGPLERAECGHEIPAPSHRVVIASNLEDVYDTLRSKSKSVVPLEIEIIVPSHDSIVTVESASIESSPDKRHGKQLVFHVEANLQRVGNFRRHDTAKIRERLQQIGLHTNDPTTTRFFCWLNDADHMGGLGVDPQPGTNVFTLRTRRKPTHEKRIYPYLRNYEDFSRRLSTFQLIASHAVSAIAKPTLI